MNSGDAEEQSVERPEWSARKRSKAQTRSDHREALEDRIRQLELELEDAKSVLQDWDAGGAEREA